MSAYRHIRNDGPFHPTPGRIVRTASPPELGVSTTGGQVHEVLSETTRSAGLLAANVGGNFGIDIAVTAANSSDAAAADFAPGAAATDVGGQALAFPAVWITGGATAAHEAEVSAEVTLTATNSSGGDPAVLHPIQTITATARVLNPSTGSDENGQPFQTTIFVAVLGLVSDPGVLNEFLDTSLADYLATQPDVSELDTLDHGSALMDPTTDLRDQFTVQPWIKDLPEDNEKCTNWLNPAGPPGRMSFAQTVITSAEVQSGADTYDASIDTCEDNDQTVIRAIRLNVPDTRVFGGSFSPTESVHFVDPGGDVGDSESALTDVTTSRTFEVALIDTAVRIDGSLETGASDDFGILIEVEEVEPNSPMLDGEFVFVSFTGGRQGADVDTLAVPPGNLLATVTLLDLDNLHEVLGIRSIEAMYIIDVGETGEVEIIEAFSLNLASSPATEACCLPDDSCAELEPATCLDLNGTPLGASSVCSGTDTDADGTVDDCDPDDDNDGVPDGSDPNDTDPNVCGDADGDSCDDCAVGTDGFGPLPDNDPSNDGTDTDGDGQCDAGDPDDDNDGIPDAEDNCPLHHNPDQADCDKDGMGDVCAIDSGTSEDANGNGIPDECESNCPEDFDGDGMVGAFDLAFLLGNWGPNPGHPADLNGDGDVGPFDLALVLGAWGACP